MYLHIFDQEIVFNLFNILRTKQIQQIRLANPNKIPKDVVKMALFKFKITYSIFLDL